MAIRTLEEWTEIRLNRGEIGKRLFGTRLTHRNWLYSKANVWGGKMDCSEVIFDQLYSTKITVNIISDKDYCEGYI